MGAASLSPRTVEVPEDDLVAAVRYARAGMAFRDFEGPIAPMRAELAEIIRLHC